MGVHSHQLLPLPRKVGSAHIPPGLRGKQGKYCCVPSWDSMESSEVVGREETDWQPTATHSRTERERCRETRTEGEKERET